MKTMIWIAKLVVLAIGIFSAISGMLRVDTLLMVYGPATVILGALVTLFVLSAIAQDVFNEVES